MKDGCSAPHRARYCDIFPTGRTAGRMISNHADESLPGGGQMSELGRSRRFDDVFVTTAYPPIAAVLMPAIPVISHNIT